MSRTVDDRVADVRRLIGAARSVYANRARIAPQVARCTGLTPEGVALGFESLEREASDADLRALIARSGVADCVHAILSANVFVSAMRALVIARATADRVTIHPSRRDPVLAIALVEAAADPAIVVQPERDVASVTGGEIHVYGRDATIAAVRALAQPGVTVRGHGTGLGVAIVTNAADLAQAADLLAADVVPFDQRGCLSPRVALVEGDAARAWSFAQALDECLRGWGRRVPRGALLDDEPGEAMRWRDTMAFAGRVWASDHHAVALGAVGAPLLVPPAGRHLYVAPQPNWDGVASCLTPVARFVVAVGTDDPARVREIAPDNARVSRLGLMQRPPLDGPVDRRS